VKGGRKRRFPLGYTLEHARQLFEQSVAERKPDFRYVALAIGATPAAPPDWAIWACIEARRDEEGKSARGHDETVSVILDELVRFFDQSQRNFYQRNDASGDYKPPSLRSAIRTVLKAQGSRCEDAGRADGDWYVDITRAWNEEQKHDRAANSTWELEKLQTTTRIDRILTQEVARELGDPEDLHTWAWIAKRIIERRNS
jgi:hypothetical protein